MARRKDTPEVQAAKGYPGRRKKLTVAEQKAKAASPTPEEELLASLDVDGLRPPSRFARKEFAEERAVWQAVTPRLKATARASAEFQAPLAAYCDAVARYNRAVLELRRKGLTVNVATIAGGMMPRLNPAERVREKALAEILALSDRFGFTPKDNFALLKDHRQLIEAGAGRQGSLFGGQGGDRPGDGAEPAPAVGAMDGFDSLPPGSLPN